MIEVLRIGQPTIYDAKKEQKGDKKSLNGVTKKVIEKADDGTPKERNENAQMKRERGFYRGPPGGLELPRLGLGNS